MIDIEKRIRAIVHRTGVGNITSFKKHYDKQFERLQDRLSLIDVNDRLYWVPSVRSVKGVGEMCNVSQAPIIKPPRYRKKLRIRERL